MQKNCRSVPYPTYLEVIILSGDLIIIFVPSTTSTFTQMMTIVVVIIIVPVTAPISTYTGRSHCRGCGPADNYGWGGGHEQPEAARMETGTVAVHQNHCGGKVERTCGQDPIRWLAEERLAGHQTGGIVVVAWRDQRWQKVANGSAISIG